MASVRAEQSKLRIAADEDNSRLDRVLIRRLGAERRPLILRLIRKGNVRLNRKRARPESRVRQGDEVFLPASLRQPVYDKPEAGIPRALLNRAGEVRVLYEDDALLAVDKPAGIVVHAGSGYHAGLIEALREVRGLADLRLAHRLDRDTSGVLLMAKNLNALRRLHEAFRAHDMQKVYLALVAGHPRATRGRLHGFLQKGVVRGGERVVRDDRQGKEALTDYQLMLRLRWQGLSGALLALKPYSGRTHQLRVQLADAGHAILGDGKYGAREENRRFRALGGRRLALHAWRLRFAHPDDGCTMEIRASWPEEWKALIRAGL
ncbi:MAG: RluA family pseudouridine synthase [Zetaproteobacteria bacterium]|nr:MAG: RluA family pseudouridine synthase [Zetaproteobacteria bacterium]